MSIRSDGKVVIPGTSDWNIGVTNRDGGRSIVADDSIRSAHPDPWSRVNPDNDGCILAGAGTYGRMIIIKDIRFEVIDDLVNNGIVIGQGISEGQDVTVDGTALSPRYVSIRSYGKIVVPGPTDRSIGVTNRDGGGSIVADDSIRSTHPDPWSRVNPDNDGCILAGTGT